jgi:hypothetical protein
LKKKAHLNYRKVQCCFNCIHVFNDYNWDDSGCYYCTNRAAKRPKCGSVAQQEERFAHETYAEESEAWRKWANINQVKEDMVCDNWKEK